MEKIYMQDSQEVKKQKQKKGLRSNVDFSVALSVIVAAFALFSIGAFGIINNQGDTVSYAAPADGFTMVSSGDGSGADGVIAYTESGDDAVYTTFYYANSRARANHVFCVEMRNEVLQNGEAYSKDASEFATKLNSDPGLIYILQNSMASGKKITTYTGDYEEEIEAWATQAAIWSYLAQKYPDNSMTKYFASRERVYNEDDPDPISLQTEAAFNNATKFQLVGGTSVSGDTVEGANATNVTAKVKELVAKAKTITNVADAATLDVSATEDLSKTPDGKYYQTGLISVVGNPSNALQTYDIKVNGVAGAKVVDQSGKDLTLTGVPAGTKFYVRVPVGSVIEETKSVDVSITGHFSSGKLIVFAPATNHQKVVGLGPVDIPSGIQFDIVGSPDTGMNAAQTIYFIGLIVLLCGVGIVYANTKPVESKQ